MLFNVEAENRNASENEQEILAGYLGWGGLVDVFDESKSGQYGKKSELLSKRKFKRRRL